MKMKMMFAILAVSCGGSLCALGDEPAAMSLPRSTPEAQGVSSARLLEFIAAADKREGRGLDEQTKATGGLHSVMVVRHGQVILEGWWGPFDAATPHSLYSLSKSFTSTAVGLAVAEGKLSVDDPVLKFFPNDAPTEPSTNLKSMRVSDLLRMSTGHQAEPKVGAGDSQPWTKTFLAQPVAFKPGTHFVYNTPATYMASAIVQQATGQTTLDYLKPRLFDPLGIKDPTWGTSPQGVSLGGYGLNVRTEDIAKFGQLYLQKGRWQGKQLVPESWVDAATARQTSNGSAPTSDWDQGYGYQFWRSRHGAFRGDGAFGQFCVVMPEQDTVVAITSGTNNLQGVLNLVWDNLLPALETSPLPANPTAEAALRDRLANLKIEPISGDATSGTAQQVGGKRFAFAANPLKLESLILETNMPNSLVLRVNGADQQIALTPGSWTKGTAALGPVEAGPTATTGAWTSPDTVSAHVAFVTTPFIATMKLKFTEKEVQVTTQTNVGFGPTRLPMLTGRTE